MKIQKEVLLTEFEKEFWSKPEEERQAYIRSLPENEQAIFRVYVVMLAIRLCTRSFLHIFQNIQAAAEERESAANRETGKTNGSESITRGNEDSGSHAALNIV